MVMGLNFLRCQLLKSGYRSLETVETNGRGITFVVRLLADLNCLLKVLFAFMATNRRPRIVTNDAIDIVWVRSADYLSVHFIRWLQSGMAP